ncbi:transglutaminase family protein [Paenibacillus sp. R14(2021)]|uniref:transglutaminase-like domain-containing protein n=1 Tax=Paenibacillus sp. R14(2021) TaxID=2859228 RepID=UPI001C61375F|nr:transglutaminase-like domain-containing protein [Paenibacillus sp. R14(2021)]
MSRPQMTGGAGNAGKHDSGAVSGEVKPGGTEEKGKPVGTGGAAKPPVRTGGPSKAAGSRLSKRQAEREGLQFFSYFTRRLITSMLLFGLIVEWLLPLQQLQQYTELYQVSPLLTAVGLFLAVGLFVPPAWTALLLNGCITIGAVLFLFMPQYHSVPNAVQALLRAIQHDALQMAQGNMMLSGETRTLLLISGLGMMSIAVQSLMWLRQWGLGLTALTAVYLLLLYGFLGLPVFPGLLRACAEGLLLSALVTVPRIERLTGTSNLFAAEGGRGILAGWTLGWWSGSAWLAVVIVASGIGASWSWSEGDTAKPAPWAAQALKWGEARMGEGSARTHTTAEEAMAETGLDSAAQTGYGFDDSKLGSPLTRDHTVLMTVVSKEAAYLRGDSKDIYTGSGWEQKEHDWQAVTVEGGDSGSKLDVNANSNAISSEAGGAPNTPFVQTVTAAVPTAGLPLFAGGSAAKVTALVLMNGSKEDSQEYKRDEATGALYPASDDNRVVRYMVETAVPAVHALRESDQGEASAAGVSDWHPASDPDEAAYTQLPAGLPARVSALAAQILADAGHPQGRYEQAVAIADYLRGHYAYDLDKTSIPAAGMDFVDDFLFRQKQGYCVHFASAMAVMLRTQGIPARYVKGFAAGEESRQAGSGEAALYTVRASDAHAWVEVLFPGVGWAAFEPTPGFAAPGSGASGEAGSPVPAGEGAKPGAAASVGGAAGTAGGEAAGARGMAGRLAAQLRAAAVRGAHAAAEAGRGAMASPPWAKAACAAGAVGAAGLAMAARRRKHERFAFAPALRRYGSAIQAGRHTAARSQFLQLADALWRELYKQCGAKPLHRTAREYAAALNLPPHTAPLVANFVRWDEEARYDAIARGLPTPDQMSELIAKWPNGKA